MGRGKRIERVVRTPDDKASKNQLISFVERIERLEGEKAELASDISDLYVEVKSSGFDVPTVRQIVKLRKAEGHKLEEQAHILETYCRAVGLSFDDTPLGAAMAVARKAAE
jgi:uncharacterized protein (UPF0335 family)